MILKFYEIKENCKNRHRRSSAFTVVVWSNTGDKFKRKCVFVLTKLLSVQQKIDTSSLYLISFIENAIKIFFLKTKCRVILKIEKCKKKIALTIIAKMFYADALSTLSFMFYKTSKQKKIKKRHCVKIPTSSYSHFHYFNLLPDKRSSSLEAILLVFSMVLGM